MSSSLPPAGWYPDSAGGGGARYFDGAQWTEWRDTPPAVEPKSAAVGGLLQFFLGWLGIGRFYLGYSGLGALQLILGLIGLITTPIFIGLVILIPLAVWTFVEAIMMFAGGIKEKGGHAAR